MHPMTLDRAAQWQFARTLLIVGVCFLAGATFSPDLMPESVYGPWAYDIDAEAWAGAFIACAAMVLYGLHINGRWFWSPMLRFLGYLGLVGLFGLIGWSALSAPHGLHLVIFAWVDFVPRCIRFLRISSVDMARRFQIGKAA